MEAARTPADSTMDATAALSPEPQAARTTTEPLSKPANALTPPTSEEMNHEETKEEHEDSELSDLELDDEDEVDIEPDHYWDGGNIPVFKPTMDQFRSFKKFIDKINKYGMKSGIVKVIPPKEWRENLPALDEMVKRIKIKNPITQEFNGTSGTYTQQNVEKQRSYNLPEWKSLTEETQYQPPAKRGERRRNQEKVVRGGGSLRSRNAATAGQKEDSPKPRKKPGRPRRNAASTEEVESGDDASEGRRTRTQVPPTPDSPATKPAKAKPGPKAKGARQPKGGQAKSVSSRRLNNTSEAANNIDEAAYQDFDYHMDGLDEFTPERCAELETHYWKSLAFNQPMYAADMPGSLFDDSTTSWNVSHLENLLDILGTKVPGVNTAYLYMGMWKATFAWHLEDVDLYSINYIHFGAPKQWYSISQQDARKFEAAMRQIWPTDAKACDQFLRHKTYLISPDVLLKQYGVKVNKLVHYEGEFVITYPYGYHSGYNVGYNCAESVNFATESWLEYGRIARKCNCEADNVWVDVSEIERKLRGEPTPEYYEETDDEDDLSDEDGNLPSPPASVKGKAQRGKKRKRDVKEEKPKKKKKIRIKIRAPTREPCVMCPNDNPWEPLLPTDNAKKAHRSCALFTPETWIERDAQGKEKVCGVTSIDRARLELKCNFCRSKRGACFQCSSKKCTRAFHASCALAAGVLIDAGMVPTFGEDGTEYFEEGYDFRCKYHRPRMPKVLNLEALENSKRINNYAKDVKFNDVVQAQYVGGEVFAGLVVENRPSELSLVVDVLPEGDRMEVEWKWLCVLDPDDSQRPKPSASALPMPEGMNKKAVSVNNRQDGVPTQEEPFHDNPEYKWHDFYNMHMPPPGYATKQLEPPAKLNVKIDEPDQLYFYMPTISTEAKCFFTDKVGGKEIATKGAFLDRVAARPTYQYAKYAAAQRQPIMAHQPTPAPVRPQQPVHRVQPVHPMQPVHAIQSMHPMQPAQSMHPMQPMQDLEAFGTIGNPANRSEKPYTYKPKDPARPNVMWGIDPQSLATQRSFLAEAGRHSSQYSLPPPNPQNPLYNYQGSDPARNATPSRPFPREQYYSSERLPAAYPGEYSGFMQVTRRESQGSQTLQMPESQSENYVPNYQSVKEQSRQLKHGAPTVPMMGGSAHAPMPSNPYASSSSRPSSSTNSHQSPLGVPLTPATTASSMSKSAETPPGYLENLQKYPYLKNSFLRTTKPYESPYPIGGGFSSAYQPLALDRPADQGADRKTPHAHTPSASISSVGDAGRRASQQWTPPSQIWHSAGFSKQQTPPLPQPQPQATATARRYPAPTYQTPSEFQESFQQSFQPTPSTASRDGAQARLMREHMGGYGPYAPHGYVQPQHVQPQHVQPQHVQPQHVQPHRNSFGNPYVDTAKMWASPQAPTPSPLSDPNTPGAGYSHTPTGGGAWNALPRAQASLPGPPMAPMMQQQSSGAGYGPMLPQMHGGNETWRYN
ncbi:hypothetical protein LTR36_000158 [Oleoguttula mirabilis]|uniref:[histone H3]-trimethyl-L-lysine(9) demethylase n=1 Tax=Oleoguttula mirabilis TaxID=1507867 RepID=A0AAV9JY64_9PEZI|nr:hypothetical protein LTR36_000158 [Oleoguttula mirabilis]